MQELGKETNGDMLLAEAKRCLKCKVAKCKKACPIATDIPTIMNLFLEGEDEKAGRIEHVRRNGYSYFRKLWREAYQLRIRRAYPKYV